MQTINFIAHSKAERVTCSTDMDSHMTCSADTGIHMTCSTDTDSRMTCSKKHGSMKTACSCKATPLAPIYLHDKRK